CDWSSDVCSSDLHDRGALAGLAPGGGSTGACRPVPRREAGVPDQGPAPPEGSRPEGRPVPALGVGDGPGARVNFTPSQRFSFSSSPLADDTALVLTGRGDTVRIISIFN